MIEDEVPLLLVVCTGNVCRSPMAEAVLVKYLADQELEARVISRGLAAPIGRPPHEHALNVAASRGTPISPSKRAEPLLSAEVSAASAILVMDSSHRREIALRFPMATGKTFLLGKWQDQEIADPIGAPRPVFEFVWDQIVAGVRSWVCKMKDVGMLGATPPSRRV